MKKIILLLVLSAFCPLWTLAQFSGQGSGTADDPFQITNADELYQVRSNSSSYFILMNDIDLTDWLAENSPVSGWTPAATFEGTFDGKGFTIKYFTDKSGSKDVGLFAVLYCGTIKNLNVIGNINCTDGGGIVGYVNGGTIKNCTFRGTINAKNAAGGIVGTMRSSTISNSSVSADIKGETVGGIVGVATEVINYIECCSFWGKITDVKNFSYLGGIIGKYSGTNSKYRLYINNCFFGGTISSSFDYTQVGGITTTSQYTTINNSIVSCASLKGSYPIAGIAANYSTIRSCVVIVDTIQYQRDDDTHYRVGGSATGDGTSAESLALATMVVIKKGASKPDNIVDGGANGVSMGRSMLMKASTYTNHEFDMQETWNIVEGKGYPYLRCAADFMSIMGGSQNIPFEETDVTKLTDAIYANAVSTSKGSTVATMTINLKNAQATNAYSFDLVLPEGVTIDSYTLSSRHNGHAETMNRNETTGVYSFAVLSLQSKEVEGNDGAIWTLKLRIADDIAEGDYAVKIQNAKYSLTSGSAKVSIPETISKFNVENYVKGDVNGDREADIADAVCIVNHVVGKATPVFIAKAADVNGDGDADIADAVRIVNLVVGKIDALARKYEGDRNLPNPE